MEDVNTLRSMYDKIQVCVRNLSDLGVETTTYGSLLISILFDRIPSELRLIASRKFQDTTWTLDELLKIYKGELSARERCKAVGGEASDTGFSTGQTLFNEGSKNTRNGQSSFSSGGRSYNPPKRNNACFALEITDMHDVTKLPMLPFERIC